MYGIQCGEFVCGGAFSCITNGESQFGIVSFWEKEKPENPENNLWEQGRKSGAFWWGEHMGQSISLKISMAYVITSNLLREV